MKWNSYQWKTSVILSLYPCKLWTKQFFWLYVYVTEKKILKSWKLGDFFICVSQTIFQPCWSSRKITSKKLGHIKK